MFSLSYDMYLTHAGLPLGWTRGDRLSSGQIKAVESCRHVLSRDDNWQRPDTRISAMTIAPAAHPHYGDQLIMAIGRMPVSGDLDRSDTPYLVHIVMGCVITDRPFSQLAVIRGTYWQIGDKIIAGDWQLGTS
jgi:hypothetical protein